MNIRTQALLFTGVVLATLVLTQVEITPYALPAHERVEASLSATSSQQEISGNLSFQSAALLNPVLRLAHIPSRKWEVLDPHVNAKGVLIQLLDENTPLLRHDTHKVWPTASLAKLVTSVVVLEEIGLNKKIPISKAAVATEAEAGNLVSGEIYTSRDLLKIMLLTSSNDAATAFEEYLGGRSTFVRKMNDKAVQLGMTKTIFHDASGLSDLNETTASDMYRLVVYILESYPDVIGWTRLSSFLVQPINDTTSKVLYNINPLVADPNFLGGKTGTSPASKENFVVLFSFHDYRVLAIMLGSSNRVSELDQLLSWVEEAYIF